MILSNDVTTLDYQKGDLMKTFRMKDLGAIHWFLGLEIVHDRARHLISINQTRYITDVISHFDFINSCPISTPIPVNFKLP